LFHLMLSVFVAMYVLCAQLGYQSSTVLH
jgi:hypothetical protein